MSTGICMQGMWPSRWKVTKKAKGKIAQITGLTGWRKTCDVSIRSFFQIKSDNSGSLTEKQNNWQNDPVIQQQGNIPRYLHIPNRIRLDFQSVNDDLWILK